MVRVARHRHRLRLGHAYVLSHRLRALCHCDAVCTSASMLIPVARVYTLCCDYSGRHGRPLQRHAHPYHLWYLRSPACPCQASSFLLCCVARGALQTALPHSFAPHSLRLLFRSPALISCVFSVPFSQARSCSTSSSAARTSPAAPCCSPSSPVRAHFLRPVFRPPSPSRSRCQLCALLFAHCAMHVVCSCLR